MLFVVPEIPHRLVSWGRTEGSTKSLDRQGAPKRTEETHDG
jgi:hypothetical protein